MRKEVIFFDNTKRNIEIPLIDCMECYLVVEKINETYNIIKSRNGPQKQFMTYQELLTYMKKYYHELRR